MRLILATCLATSGCLLPQHFSGRPGGVTTVDGQTVGYRELHSDEAGEVLFTLHVPGAPRDVVRFAGLLARDDGWGPDRVGGDGQFTGTYPVAEARTDPHWISRTRPHRPGEQSRTLPPAEEQLHPFANRRSMAGGPGGDFDNSSVCPPGFVQTGVRFKRDEPGHSIAQLGAICRAPPRPSLDGEPTVLSRSLVEGTNWGEDIKTAHQVAECPRGHALLADGVATMGRWARYQVLTGLTLRCADTQDPHRHPTQTLSIGFPDENGSAFKCPADGPRPAFAQGLRIISGMRIDAIGFVCEAGSDDAVMVRGLRFPVTAGQEVALSLPLQREEQEVPSLVHVAARLPSVENGALVLPVADATVQLRPLGVGAAHVVAPVAGCVDQVGAERLRLSVPPPGGSCGEPSLRIELDGAVGWWARAGIQVAQGEPLGVLRDGAVRMRLLSRAVVAEPPEDGPLPPTALSVISAPGWERVVIPTAE